MRRIFENVNEELYEEDDRRSILSKIFWVVQGFEPGPNKLRRQPCVGINWALVQNPEKPNIFLK